MGRSIANTAYFAFLIATNFFETGLQFFRRDTELLLTVQVRCVPEGSYLPAQDVIWDCTSGATSQSLYHDISARVGYPPQEFIIAKHFPHRYVWKVIESMDEVTVHGQIVFV